MDELHPISNTPLFVAYPFLRPCLKDEKASEVKCDKKNKVWALDDNDPLVELGYGIVAYNNILMNLFWAFVLFSILLIPTIYGYKTGISR